MPNIGFPELILILVVALIVFGPKRLPEIGRSVGKGLREFRKATSSLKEDFERDLDEDERATPEASPSPKPAAPLPVALGPGADPEAAAQDHVDPVSAPAPSESRATPD